MAKQPAKKPTKSTRSKATTAKATAAKRASKSSIPRKKYWYVIRTTELVEGGSKKYIGSSTLTNTNMLKALATSKPLVINDLLYVSIGGELKKYSETWEPHPNTVYLMPGHIASVIPLGDDWQDYKSSWEDSLLNKVETFFSSIK